MSKTLYDKDIRESLFFFKVRMPRFVVFDVETPNHNNDRMSAIGIHVMEDGQVVQEYESLVNPETFFDAFNIRSTGISEEAVMDASEFQVC